MPRVATPRARKEPATLTPILIPDRLYFRISEVSKLTQTKQYVLRYWESEFPRLRPRRARSGHRLYRRKDVEMILEIKRLLYEKGFTLEGARRALAGHPNDQNQQKALFNSTLDSTTLREMRRELGSILTILSRKC